MQNKIHLVLMTGLSVLIFFAGCKSATIGIKTESPEIDGKIMLIMKQQASGTELKYDYKIDKIKFKDDTIEIYTNMKGGFKRAISIYRISKKQLSIQVFIAEPGSNSYKPAHNNFATGKPVGWTLKRDVDVEYLIANEKLHGIKFLKDYDMPWLVGDNSSVNPIDIIKKDSFITW